MKRKTRSGTERIVALQNDLPHGIEAGDDELTMRLRKKLELIEGRKNSRSSSRSEMNRICGGIRYFIHFC